jgi:hypothetical protein
VTATNTKKTEYIVQKIGEYKISVQSWKDFRNGDFETLYATGNAEGVEKPVVRAKPAKKSKEQEQSDFQKEILRKNYTTTTNFYIPSLAAAAALAALKSSSIINRVEHNLISFES